MDKAITSYIKENDMLRTGDTVIAAVSGGADSMCMLFCLSELSKELSLSVHVLHVNHGIRGEEADRDEAFVKEFCSRNNIPFSSFHADVPAVAEKEGKTLEEAGREVRYNALFEAARANSAAAVALAHNQNDRAETVLLNLLRGSGINGSVGIHPVSYRNGIKLIRPLLATSRARIEEILAEAGITYITDSTNLSDDHTRNRLRSHVFPLLSEQINPRSIEHICSFAKDMAEASDFIASASKAALKEALDKGNARIISGPATQGVRYTGSTDKVSGGEIDSETTASVREISINAEYLRSLHPAVATGVIRILVSKLTSSLKDISRVHITMITDLADAGTSRIVSLPYGLTAQRTRDDILITINDGQTEKAPAEAFFSTRIYEGEELKTALALIERDISDASSNKNCTKWFDYDNICGKLQFRYPQPRDTITVLMGENIRHKEAAKVFREAGITALQASKIPVAACGSDVIWIPGIRRCDSLRVTPETKRILEITCSRPKA